MLLGLLSSLTSFTKVRYVDNKAVIDNTIFRLHYRFTSAFFFAACVVITAFDIFGKPMHCTGSIHGASGGDSSGTLTTYCWLNGTFSLVDKESQCLISSKLYYPGIGQDDGKHEQRVHSYYQWVPLVLFLQGILFWLPHRLWKQHEHGKIRQLTAGIRGHVIADTESRKKHCETISNQLQLTLHKQGQLALAHVTCELLNFVNAIGNIYLIDRFLNGQFLNYGSKVMQYLNSDSQKSECNPMYNVFPRMAMCNYKSGGVSGDIDSTNFNCLLPLNIVNEKIYVFLWFWLVILSVLSGLALVYRIVSLLFPMARTFILRQMVPNRSSAEAVVWRIPYGGFFMLSLLSKNIECFLFNDVLDELSHRLRHDAKSPDQEDGSLRPNVVYSPMTKNSYSISKTSVD